MTLSARPAFDEPLSNLVHQRLLHVRSLGLAQFVFDADERLLILLLVHILRLTSLDLGAC